MTIKKKTKKGGKKTQAVKAVTDRRTTLDQKKKESMLAVLIRNQEAHESVSELLKPRFVEEGIGSGHALVWKMVKDFYAKHEELPTKDIIVPELHNLLKADEDLLSEDELGETDDFIEFVFDDAEHGKKMPKSPLLGVVNNVAVRRLRGL